MLNEREIQVLRLIASGRNRKQVSDELKISKKTVDSHQYNILRKLEVEGVKNSVHLVHYAIARGITSLQFSDTSMSPYERAKNAAYDAAMKG